MRSAARARRRGGPAARTRPSCARSPVVDLSGGGQSGQRPLSSATWLLPYEGDRAVPANPLNVDDFGGELFNLGMSPEVRPLLEKVTAFVADEVEPVTEEF